MFSIIDNFNSKYLMERNMEMYFLGLQYIHVHSPLKSKSLNLISLNC